MAQHRLAAWLGGLWLLAATPLAAAENPEAGDLRDLKVGIPVNQLPGKGYASFACGHDGAPPGEALTGWQDFARCPADAAGLHEVAFSFDDTADPWATINDRWRGTKVAGHPVIASLLIDGQGLVQGMRMVTDPESPPYLRKKAFLFPIRIMGRYGRDGWQCADRPPAEGRQEIGGMYIDRHCEKTFHDRQLSIDTALYRTAEQTGKRYTDRTRFEIRMHDAG